uniref:Aegyptin/gSG7 salivary protein-like four-helix bundle domain-containing protein n=1 Tax=Anopheles farauti TaxID=69004 RepID=A0A182QEI8_9DIPT
MKLVLLLAGVLCLALIVTARPQDESAEEALAELSEDASKEDAGAEDGSTGTEDDSDSDAGGSEGDESAGDGEAEAKEDDVNDSDDGADKEGEQSEGDEAAGGDAAGGDAEGGDAEGGDGDGSNGDGGSAEGGDGEGGNAEGGDGGDGETGEADGGDKGDKGTDAGSDGEEEDDRVNTYNQVHSQLKKIMEVSTKDEYLKSYVVGSLQERLMNPTIDLVGTIGKYSKIKECFSSLAKDVDALVKGSDKSYEECTKDKTKTNCGSEGTRDLDEGLIKRQQELSNCIVEKRDA